MKSTKLSSRALLLCSCLLLLSVRLMSSAYTSGDDGYTYMAAMAPQGWAAATWEMVVFQGRFYQLLVYPIAMLPFQLDNIWIINLCKVLTFLIFYAGFFALSKSFFGAKGAFGCSALLFLLFETVGGSYNGFHGLPLWFGVTCGILLFSLAWHQQFLSSANLKYRRLSIIAFAVSLLGYEIVLLYMPLFGALTFLSLVKGSRFRQAFSLGNFKKSFSDLFPHLVISIGYLIVYFSFRSFYPGTYVGAQGLSVGSLSETLDPIWTFSVNSIASKVSESALSNLSATSIVLVLISSALLWPALNQSRFVFGSAASNNLFFSCSALLLLLAYVFLPNVLFGLTERYRTWSAHGVTVYLGSMYSAVALIFGLYAILAKLTSLQVTSSFSLLTRLIIVIWLALLGYCNSADFISFYKQSNTMSVRWDVAKKVSKYIATAPVENGGNYKLCLDGFMKNNEFPTYFRNRDMIADAQIYWERYFSAKSGRGVDIIDSMDVSSQICDGGLTLSYSKNLTEFRYGGSEVFFPLSDIKSLPNFIDPFDFFIRASRG